MRKKTKLILIITTCALLLTTSALAADGYQISWWTIDNGGGSSQSADGQYTLDGTIGQPDAGASAGSGYAIQGGFWQSIRDWLLHLPLVIR